MSSFLVPLEYLGCFCQRSCWVLAEFFRFVKGLGVTTSYSPYQLRSFKSNYMWDLWYSVTMKTHVVWFTGSWWGGGSRSGRLDIGARYMLTSWGSPWSSALWTGKKQARTTGIGTGWGRSPLEGRFLVSWLNMAQTFSSDWGSFLWTCAALEELGEESLFTTFL